jgi:hypothetical protein
MADEASSAPKVSTTSQNAGLVNVLHTERNMKVYGVTENELRTLTAINVAVTALFSIATGLMAFSFDLQKDILLAEPLPDKAQVLDTVVQPAAFLGSLVLYGLGALTWFLRGGFLKTIKKESRN